MPARLGPVDARSEIWGERVWQSLARARLALAMAILPPMTCEGGDVGAAG